MTQLTAGLTELAAQVWAMVGGPPEVAAGLTVSGPRTVLPSVFDVTGLATASVAAATLAAAEYGAARNGATLNGAAVAAVRADSQAACAAFAAEALFTPDGWALPDIWDPVAGNYRARDQWIRLHTNYAYHRAAVSRVLKADDRAAVQAAVSGWEASDLEAAVVAEGGCAAVMHDRDGWLATAAGAACAADRALSVAWYPLRAGAVGAAGAGADRPTAASRPTGVDRSTGVDRPTAASSAAADSRPAEVRGRAQMPARQPYAGVRVLDLTRVIAGPMCTRFLAAYGADVLRLDPPGFAEVPALLPETTAGKRTATADLTAAGGRAAFERLIAGADVLVTGLRADALSSLGYDDAALRALNPALIIASLNAYGWQGPWRDRRGFDSLVQMSCGIAAAGATATSADRPVPLPVQALDHATGYLLAAGVGRALTGRLTDQAVSRIWASLTGTANLLWSLPRPAELADQPPMPRREDIPLTSALTAWGPAHRVALPGAIDGVTPGLPVEAGPLGRHLPSW